MTRPSVADAVFIDFETAIAEDYNLERMSARAYIQDSRLDILSVAIGVGTGDIQFFHKCGPAGGAVADGIEVIRQALAQGRWLVCHNAGFDALILKLRYDISPTHVFDTQDYAAYLGLGTSLANLALHVGMKKLEAPPFEEASLSEPMKLKQMARYNANDVRITRRAFEVALADSNMPDAEFDVIDITARNNAQGLRLDAARAEAVACELAAAKNHLYSDLAGAHHFDTSKLGSITAVRSYIEERFGVRPPSLRKDDSGLLQLAGAHPDLARFLHQRRIIQTLARCATQVSGYSKIGGRVYAPLRYCGAHTGRFSGRGRDSDNLNVQNLPKAKRAPHPAIGLIRKIILPEPGRSFVAADLSTIEARVIAALASEQGMLDIFHAHEDIYVWLGSLVFPSVKIVKDGENDHLRKLCKEAVLGLGFGMGFDTFLERVLIADPGLSPTDIRRVFDTYQARFPRIAQVRHRYWRAFRAAADTGQAEQVGRCLFVRGELGAAGPTVVVVLPTERRLFYRAIEPTEELRPWGKMGRDYWYNQDYEYVVIGTQRRRRGAAGEKSRKCADGRLRALIKPHGIVENIVQAVARDILMHQMLEIHRAGRLRPVFHTHDDLVCECEACVCPEPLAGEFGVHAYGCPWVAAGAELVATMSRVPSTLPDVSDIPLGAELSRSVRVTYGG